jgi:DNA topoisomerase-3
MFANTRQMEVQMKAICEGRTTRNAVVQQNLEQYRAVFNRTAQQMNVLKSVREYCSSLCRRTANAEL